MLEAHVTPYPRIRLALALLLLAGLFLRTWDVWAYMPAMDEIQFLIIAQSDSISELLHRGLAEVHPPLAHILRHFILLITDSIVLQRLISGLFGMLTVWGAYLLGKEACGTREAGLISAGYTAFAPHAVVVSLGIRNYPFFLCFLLWSVVFLLRWERKEKPHNVLLYIIFMLFATATHFSGFMIAAALGLAQGLRLLLAGPPRKLLMFSALHLPMAVVAMVAYMYYFAPGTTIPMWQTFALASGFTPEHPEKGLAAQLGIPLLAYFSPFLDALHNSENAAMQQSPPLQGIVLLLGIITGVLYVVGLWLGYRKYQAACRMTLWVWAVALLFSVIDLYPLAANRHNLCMLPFFILPISMIGMRPVRALLQSRIWLVGTMFVTVLGTALSYMASRQDIDVSFRVADYTAGQTYLNEHIAKGDVIDTEVMGAYFYLTYAHNGARLPYNDYGDKPYFKDTIILAPFGSPYKPYSSWRPFRETLARRLEEGVAAENGNVWFVQYGWKNQEIWTLMQCSAARPLMENFMSRDGVVIFSMKVAALKQYLKNDEAWEKCYAGYKPLVVGTPFHKVTLEDAP